jgi:hypothetical protein
VGWPRIAANTPWYHETIEIHESWQGKRVVLFPGPAMWETRLWPDDDLIGMLNSHCVEQAQRFQLHLGMNVAERATLTMPYSQSPAAP